MESILLETTLKCDPNGPYTGCGGNGWFDSNATCLVSEAVFGGGKTSWCTQIHCCKEISPQVIFGKALVLNGTECDCPRSHPCLGVQFGKCKGSGWEEDYENDTDIFKKCYDKRFPGTLPCINGYVTIPEGIVILHWSDSYK